MNIRQALSTEGRLTRTDFLKLLLPRLLVFFGIALVAFVALDYIAGEGSPIVFHIVYPIVGIITAALALYLFYGICSRRLYDSGEGAATFRVGYFTLALLLHNTFFFYTHPESEWNIQWHWGAICPASHICPLLLTTIFFLSYFFRKSKPEHKEHEETDTQIPSTNESESGKTQSILSQSLCYIGLVVCAILISAIPYLIIQCFDCDAPIHMWNSPAQLCNSETILLILFTTIAYRRARKYGYTLFYTFGIIFMAYATAIMGLTTQLIHTGLCIYAALIFTGILRSKAESTRPLSHLIIGTAALFITASLYSYTRGTLMEICAYIAVIQCVRYYYEYLLNIKLTKGIAITASLIAAFAVYIAAMHTMTHILTQEAINSIWEASDCMYDVPDSFYGCSPYEGFLYDLARHKMSFYYHLLPILIIGCIMFAPHAPLMSDKEQNSNTCHWRTIHRLFIGGTVLFAIGSICAAQAFNFERFYLKISSKLHYKTGEYHSADDAATITEPADPKAMIDEPVECTEPADVQMPPPCEVKSYRNDF